MRNPNTSSPTRTVRSIEQRPRFATDTVIMKLKRTPAVAARFTAAATRGTLGVSTPRVVTLIEEGYIRAARPVFDSQAALIGSRAPARALAATLTRPQGSGKPRKSHGLMALDVASDVDAADLARHLASMADEVEFAFVPAIKYPATRVPQRSGKKRGSRVRRAQTAGDPLASRQWGHAAVRVFEARQRGGFDDAREIRVAVVDSGIDREHPDLDPVIVDYQNFHADTEDDRDTIGHGTHVAGIIGAEANNSIGIAGLCAARIVACKGLPNGDWDAAKYYRSLAYPIDAGAKVVNLSLGGEIDPGEEAVVADLLDAGISVIAAMGNEFLEGNPVSYPAAYDGVVAVGATDETDRRARFSNTGRHIALVAPGVRILSTVPRYPTVNTAKTDYDSWDGTSMATPYVAAAAALAIAKKPSLAPAAVRKLLIETADLVPGQTAPDAEYGHGRLNIDRMLQSI